MASGGGDDKVEVVEYAMIIDNFTPDPVIVESSQRGNPIKFSIDFWDADYGILKLHIDILEADDWFDSDYDLKYAQRIKLEFEGMEQTTSGKIEDEFALDPSLKPDDYDLRIYA